MTGRPRILVIKLGALGDFIYALGPMRAIRDHHKNAHLILLTQKPYEALAKGSGIFDEICIDSKPRLNPLSWLRQKKFQQSLDVTRVYDLQNNDRTERYFKLFPKKPEWVGAAEGASHRNTDPNRRKFHAFQGLRKNLELAGIADVALDMLDWMKTDISRFNLALPFALLVPGSSAARLAKRWPEAAFTKLAKRLAAEGIQPVLLGAEDEAGLCARIAGAAGGVDLSGRTDIADLAALGKSAAVAVGNDTGPMHILSVAGCPVLMFFNRAESHVLKHGPQSPRAECFEADDLNEVTVDVVLSAAHEMMDDRA